MKILIVMNYRAGRGGHTGAIEELISSLRKEGFFVDIISTHGRVRERIKNIISIFKISSCYDFILAVGAAYYAFLPILVGVAAGRAHKKETLVDFHEDSSPFMDRFGRIVKLFLGDIPITVASKCLWDIFEKYKFNVFLIPHHFHYEYFPKRHGPFVWNRRFLWVGSFQSTYDPEAALKASKLVLDKRKDVEFHFFGEGPLLKKMKNQYIHPNIIFRGFIPRPRLMKEYQHFSVFINTSFRNNFPLGLVEASFNELLVISTECGGVSTIYDDKECVFFERGNYKKLSEYILETTENPSGYDSFRVNMHKKVMGFTWDKVKKKWLSLIEKGL